MAQHSSTTPVMRQYFAAKQEHPGCLLFFRLGDFFELFYDDAIRAAKDLEITLTKRRDRTGNPIPMCGVPAHSVDGYLAKLLKKGHRIAICDQVEDPKQARKLVKREVVRVLSPGTTSDLNLLNAGENNYLAAVHSNGSVSGLAYVDVSTGEFRATELGPAEVQDMLQSLGVKELLRAEPEPDLGLRFDGDRREQRYTVTGVDPWVFDQDYAERQLLDMYGLHSLDGLGISGHPLAVATAGALLHYLKDTQRSALAHLERPKYVQQAEWMVLDPVTVRHLELFDSLYQQVRTTLLFTLDRTATPMGARLQRSWLLRPSLDLEEIEQRLEAVQSLCADTIIRSELESELKQLHDIERLAARVTLGSANPRDLYNLGTSLKRIPQLREFTAKLSGSRLAALLERMDALADVAAQISATIAEQPSMSVGEGNAVAEGFDSQLDELRAIQRDSRTFIAGLEQRERRATGIESLKVRFNNVFGFFIEVSKSNLSKVPEHYERKQTLVNAERFATAELKELEAKVLDAETSIAAREAAIFQGLVADVAAQAGRIRTSAAAIAEIDVLRGLAEVAVERSYSRPRFTPGGEIQIKGGRHPVVERVLEEERGEGFIENDVHLDSDEHLVALITGPNMGGKSTYLRQTALIAVMAQIGSFVPARSAVLPLIDRIFTRIGASDNLAQGRSTFMVEMTETAQILNTATERSLVLLDEIGRGTSTYDGLAIAWAVAEYILGKVRAKTLFATHYHELTALPKARKGVFNLHVSAKQSGERLVFFHKIEAGKADRSYGIEVARLAGLPPDVVVRASEVLAHHEQFDSAPHDSPPPANTSKSVSAEESIMAEFRSVDVDRVSPFEALSLLHDWKADLDR
ncbi:MAG: DNA mismatch repair protein MutS [Acidobacteriia bacterium]|nr:DNA mismatch repair protein MutS [Terriglobia bacterium]MYG02279.1 DNA mismatch repair protein MutS [Terriglobia bacterium]